MKRSSSAPCLADGADGEFKRVKSAGEQTEISGREYLRLALARVMELQRQIRDDSYDDVENTGDPGFDSEEDVAREVLTKVFKDLPGSDASVSFIIDRAMKPLPPQLEIVRSKSIQLSGYDACRRVAVGFMRSIVKDASSIGEINSRIEIGATRHGIRSVNGAGNAHDRIDEIVFRSRRNRDNRESFSAASSDRGPRGSRSERDRSRDQRENRIGRFSIDDAGMQNRSADCELRVRMLKGLDLHLAAKQRDYTVRLMEL